MEKYIKPSIEITKVEAHEALLSFSNVNVLSDETNVIDLAPRRKDFGDLSSYDVWEQWDDGTEDDEYAVQVEANK